MARFHRYCSRPACAVASHAASQKKYLRKEGPRKSNDKTDVLRVQTWRGNHPHYWRRKVRIGRYEVRGKLADVAREFALQDMIDTHFSLVVGLVSNLTQSALQVTIASEMRRLMLLGHGILTQPTKPPAEPPPGDDRR